MIENIKILVIEDNAGDARLINIYLKEFYGDKFIFSSVDYLSKGLELLEKETFDIIILDLTLPDSSGLDTFKKIYEHSSKTPIIVLTGLEDESIGINAMKLGAQDFLEKGLISGKELSRSINYSIQRFKLLKDLSENTKKLEARTKDLLMEQIKLSEAQQLAHIGNWEWDIEKKCIIWSDELYRIYGLSPHNPNITIEKFHEMVHPDDWWHLKRIVVETKNTHESGDFYYRIVNPDSTVKTIHTRFKVISDITGNAIKMAGTSQDVTENVQKEELMKLVLAATQSYNSVVIIDKNLKIEWVNEGFTRLTNYTLKDLNGKSISILRGSSGRQITQQKNIFETILIEKKPVTFENVNYTKNGKEYWVITTATPILGKAGQIERIIAIETDISFRKQIEEELVEANRIAEQSLNKVNRTLEELTIAKKELEESMKVKSQFMANMSHEIRTPMNAVIGFTDLLLKTSLTTEQKQYIDAVKTSGKNLLVIINDILDFSKIESGKLEFEKINFRLSQLISTVIELMLPRSVEKNIRLSTKIDPNISDHLIGDPTRLNQILLNLVGNGIKFTNQGEVKIIAELQSDVNGIEELKFSVIDTGIGIPEDKLKTLFKAFTQVSNETTRKYGGTGLGLVIAKQLVELQGGTISVQSKVGEGSTFNFYLKFKKGNALESSDKGGNENFEIKELVGLKVLLVEDNLLNQILAKKVLTDWKMKVDTAENGLIAIDKLQKNDFDIILMDIQMPEMDGYDATHFIREKLHSPKSDIPIIAMTAHALTGEAERCINAGMDDYISKPFDSKVLYYKIVSVVNNKLVKLNLI
ncbi:MAG: response regulator [Bacteroidetes bacterium]|nr:response regulator [Bacteroidota bacterium]